MKLSSCHLFNKQCYSMSHFSYQLELKVQFSSWLNWFNQEMLFYFFLGKEALEKEGRRDNQFINWTSSELWNFTLFLSFKIFLSSINGPLLVLCRTITTKILAQWELCENGLIFRHWLSIAHKQSVFVDKDICVKSLKSKKKVNKTEGFPRIVLWFEAFTFQSVFQEIEWFQGKSIIETKNVATEFKMILAVLWTWLPVHDYNAEAKQTLKSISNDSMFS